MNPQQPQNPYNPAPGQFPGTPHVPSPQDYEFILNSQKPGRRSYHVGGGGKKTWLLMGGLVVVLLIIGLVAIFGRGGSGGNYDLLTKTAQDQAEIVRVANLVLAQNSVSQATENLATNVSLTVNSDLSQLKQYLSKNGHGLKDKQLTASKNTQTDTALGAANTSGNLDSAYNQTLKDELNNYQNDLRTAYKATTGPNGQKVLSGAYDNVQLLIKQLK